MGQDTDLLLRKMEDCFRSARGRPAFLGFLDEGSRAFLSQALSRRHDAPFAFWGGFPEAERAMLGVFPDYMEPEYGAFPIGAVTFSFRPSDKPGHRDFLGAMLGLGVERSVVGDILIGEGRCVAFVKAELAPYFAENLPKIGRVGVKARLGAEEPLPAGHTFKEIKGVAASSRLDCLTALAARTSREKAASMVALGQVQVNHQEVCSPSARVAEGDVLSIRGHGKYIIDRLGPVTQKGRLSVQCRKYE